MAEPNSLTKDQLLAKFNEIDTDKNGSLSREEIDTFCASLPVPPSDSEITKIFRHMDVDQDGKVTFNEFYEWWTSKENNLLTLLYAKQSVTKQLTKVHGKVQALLKDQTTTVEGGKNYKFSFKSGEAETTTGVEVKVVTHEQAQKESKTYRDVLGLGADTPAVILQIGVNPDTQAQAKEVLSDLVDQAKQLAEVMLPPEVADQYLSMVEIKVEAFSTDSLLISVSSAHPMVQGMISSYEGLLEQFRVTDQSVVVDFKAGLSLDLQQAVSASNANDVAFAALKGAEVSFSVSAAKAVVHNLKSILKTVVLDNPYKTESSKFSVQVLLAILNGFSITIESEDLFDAVSTDKLKELPIEMLIQQVKQMANPAELVQQLPLAQDLVDFFLAHGTSTLSVVSTVPNIFLLATVKTQNASALWAKLID